MTRIDDILEANTAYAATFEPGPPPDPRVSHFVSVPPCLRGSCGLRVLRDSAVNIRNAGGRVSDAIRSLAVSQAILGTEEVAIIHHTQCGMMTLSDRDIRERLQAVHRTVPDGYEFLTFEDLEQVAREDLATYRASPLVRQDIPVRILIFEVETGRLREVDPGG